MPNQDQEEGVIHLIVDDDQLLSYKLIKFSASDNKKVMLEGKIPDYEPNFCRINSQSEAELVFTGVVRRKIKEDIEHKHNIAFLDNPCHSQFTWDIFEILRQLCGYGFCILKKHDDSLFEYRSVQPGMIYLIRDKGRDSNFFKFKILNLDGVVTQFSIDSIPTNEVVEGDPITVGIAERILNATMELGLTPSVNETIKSSRNGRISVFNSYASVTLDRIPMMVTRQLRIVGYLRRVFYEDNLDVFSRDLELYSWLCSFCDAQSRFFDVVHGLHSAHYHDLVAKLISIRERYENTTNGDINYAYSIVIPGHENLMYVPQRVQQTQLTELQEQLKAKNDSSTQQIAESFSRQLKKCQAEIAKKQEIIDQQEQAFKKVSDKRKELSEKTQQLGQDVKNEWEEKEKQDVDVKTMLQEMKVIRQDLQKLKEQEDQQSCTCF